MKIKKYNKLFWLHSLGWATGILGLIAYNWWIIVPFKAGIISSPNQLFSDLEIDGLPYANIMQHLDLIAGILIICAFVLLFNRSSVKKLFESSSMIGFGLFGALGGIFSETCSDTTNAVCRHLEMTFRLPLHHYLHLIFGIAEFGFITLALIFAHYRTVNDQTKTAKIYQRFYWGAFLFYPILGLAYIFNRFGAIVEPVFFISFSIFVVLQLYERTRKTI